MAFNFFSGDPQNQAALALAAGLLEAGGPSRTPVSLGQGAARGMMSGREAFMQAQQAQQQQQFHKMKMEQFQAAQAAETQRAAAMSRLAQDPRFSGMGDLMQVAPQMALERGFPAPRAPVVVAPGSSLVNPQDPANPLFTAPDKATTPSSVKEYEYAKGQGYMGSFQQFQLEQKKAGATSVTQTVGERAADTKFAADYVEFATGGYADVQKSVSQLNDSIHELTKASKDKPGSITGPSVGILPRQALAVTNPKALSTLESVEEVVQRNLRLILGAQFTEKEGERLISRAYNPYLPESENLKRVTRLRNQIREAAEAKLSASRYWQKHKTLDGWQGKLWTINDFDPDGGEKAPQAPTMKPETLEFLKKHNITLPNG